MLERVGVQIALVERRVRAGVVGELEDLDLDPVLREQLLHQLGDLGVRPVLDAEADDVRRRGGAGETEERERDGDDTADVPLREVLSFARAALPSASVPSS